MWQWHGWYGILEWVFWALAFACTITALVRIEVFSTNSSVRQRGHAGQQVLLWVFAIVFALAGFVTAALQAQAVTA
ncbi:hypothetical protein [Specibacter cremeus]|uniref:hypothetical protein n=1 Tax=Specibacter cremeus TaxID=1629051 RepID=UPI000F7763B2|nr:hypothetical protein [Specibacter cremeus]